MSRLPAAPVLLAVGTIALFAPPGELTTSFDDRTTLFALRFARRFDKKPVWLAAMAISTAHSQWRSCSDRATS